jgi:hypothetical protein
MVDLLCAGSGDRVAPERLPPLRLTSKPVDADLKSGDMQLARWSSLITLPGPLAERQFCPAPPDHAPMTSPPPLAGFAGMSSAHLDAVCPSGQIATAPRSRLRKLLLITLAGLEALYLLHDLRPGLIQSSVVSLGRQGKPSYPQAFAGVAFADG